MTTAWNDTPQMRVDAAYSDRLQAAGRLRSRRQLLEELLRRFSPTGDHGRILVAEIALLTEIIELLVKPRTRLRTAAEIREERELERINAEMAKECRRVSLLGESTAALFDQ